MKLIKITSLVILLACLASSTAFASQPQVTGPDFAAIDAYVEAQMKDVRIPGLALGIVQGDKIVYLKGYGIADPSGRSVTAQTPFWLASLTKSMTALAIMQLAEQGKINLDAPVQQYLSWFRVADDQASRQITVRHLLYHTSGIPEMAGLQYAGREDLHPDSIEQHVRALHNVQLTHPVGAVYEYSNLDYQTLGLIIQQVTGQSYEVYMQEHVFKPLGMSQTFTDKPEAQQHGLATGFRYWFGFPMPYDSLMDRGGLPSGYVIASVEDMAHFLIPHLNGGRFGDTELVSPQSMAELLQPVAPEGASDEYYAMDWTVSNIDGEQWIFKGGDLAAFKTQMVLVPGKKWGVVTLINANNSLSGRLGDLRVAFIPMGVTKILLGNQPPIVPTSVLPSIYLGIPTLIIVLQLLGILWSIVTLRRWRSFPERRPHGFWGLTWHVGRPLIVSLGIGLFALVVMPQSLGMPISFMLYMFPDFGYSILAIGVIGMGWGLTRLALAYLALRSAKPDELISTQKPVRPSLAQK